MKNKTILFLASWYPNRKFPFNGDFIQRHALAASIDNDIIVLHACRDDEMDKHYEIVQNKEKIHEIRVYYRGSFFKPFNYFKRLIAFNKGYKLVGEHALIHLNVTYPAGVFAWYLKRFKKKKYVVTEHWTGLHPDQFSKVNFIEKHLTRKILKNAEMYLPVSLHLGKSMQRIVPNEKMQVVPNVVDTDRFQVKSEIEKQSKTRFLHLSMLNEAHKNISGMLKVAKQLADEGLNFEFHIGGNGDLTMIEQFVEDNQAQDYIKYFGALSHEEVAEKMPTYDSFVLFSNYENQPCVQIEAYSCGLFFIGTDVGGIGEFMSDNYGVLIEKGNEDQLFEAMKSIIEGREIADKKEMHMYAVNNFSKEIISSKFNDIYKQILKDEKD